MPGNIPIPLMEQHYTIREAARRAGKSESTLKRLVNAIKDDPASPDRFHLLPTPEQWNQYAQKGEPFHWTISETLLRQRFPDSIVVEGAGQTAAGDGSATGSLQSDRVIDILQRSIGKLEQQLDRKDEQIARKDEHLKTMAERVGESHVLIRDLQRQLALAAPKSAMSDATVDAAPVAPHAEQGSGDSRSAVTQPTPSSQPARKSWFSFLRT